MFLTTKSVKFANLPESSSPRFMIRNHLYMTVFVYISDSELETNGTCLIKQQMSWNLQTFPYMFQLELEQLLLHKNRDNYFVANS